ncbi:hypothetical protein J6590_106258 [Homalodisca vitripennis]|nr:hypothetical protein J6590_106258 [Homalodisca vitripennis]
MSVKCGSEGEICLSVRCYRREVCDRSWGRRSYSVRGCATCVTINKIFISVDSRCRGRSVISADRSRGPHPHPKPPTATPPSFHHHHPPPATRAPTGLESADKQGLVAHCF